MNSALNTVKGLLLEVVVNGLDSRNDGFSIVDACHNIWDFGLNGTLEESDGEVLDIDESELDVRGPGFYVTSNLEYLFHIFLFVNSTSQLVAVE